MAGAGDHGWYPGSEGGAERHRGCTWRRAWPVSVSAMNLLVRLATEADAAAVRYIGFATWPQTYGPIAGAAYVVNGLDTYWSAASVEAAIGDGNIYVAVDRNEVVGMSQVDLLDGDLVMWKLYVLPALQGRGVGSALLLAVKERARNEGRGLLTEYVAANEHAGAFYRSHGFAALGAPDTPLDAVWMRCRM